MDSLIDWVLTGFALTVTTKQHIKYITFLHIIFMHCSQMFVHFTDISHCCYKSWVIIQKSIMHYTYYLEHFNVMTWI